MRVFISGPITNGTGRKTALNQAKKVFAAAEAALVMRGFDAVNPFKVIPDSTGLTWEERMKPNITAMMNCEGIYMISGWHESKGARLEHDIALRLNYEFIK